MQTPWTRGAALDRAHANGIFYISLHPPRWGFATSSKGSNASRVATPITTRPTATPITAIHSRRGSRRDWIRSSKVILRA